MTNKNRFSSTNHGGVSGARWGLWVVLKVVLLLQIVLFQSASSLSALVAASSIGGSGSNAGSGSFETISSPTSQTKQFQQQQQQKQLMMPRSVICTDKRKADGQTSSSSSQRLYYFSSSSIVGSDTKATSILSAKQYNLKEQQQQFSSNNNILQSTALALRSTFFPLGFIWSSSTISGDDAERSQLQQQKQGKEQDKYYRSPSRLYLGYCVWSWIQDISTQLRSVLATQRVLEGVGVGRADATAVSAMLNFLVRDGCGMAASLLFTSFAASYFRRDLKRWRLFADVILDVGITMEVASMMFSQTHPYFFLAMICIGNACKAMCGVAAGSCSGNIHLHWAQQFSGSDLSDVSAKFGAQHTVTGSLGLVFAAVFAKLSVSILKQSAALWIMYTALTVLHIYANVRCMRLIAFNSFNRVRMTMVVEDYLKKFLGNQEDKPTASIDSKAVEGGGDSIKNITSSLLMQKQHTGPVSYLATISPERSTNSSAPGAFSNSIDFNISETVNNITNDGVVTMEFPNQTTTKEDKETNKNNQQNDQHVQLLKLLTPQEVSAKEPLFFLLPTIRQFLWKRLTLRSSSRSFFLPSCRVELGVSFDEFAKHTELKEDELQVMLAMNPKQNNYWIATGSSRRVGGGGGSNGTGLGNRIMVLLEDKAPPIAQAQAYFHALLLSIKMQKHVLSSERANKREKSSNANNINDSYKEEELDQGQAPVLGVKMRRLIEEETSTEMECLWPEFVTKYQESGWDLEKSEFPTSGYVILTQYE